MSVSESRKMSLDELLGVAEADTPDTVLADEVALDVEDELPSAQAFQSRIRIDRGNLVQLVVAAGPSCRRIGRVEGQQRAGRAAGRHHEAAAVEPAALGVLPCPFLGQAVCGPVGRVEGHGQELAVRGRVQLDRQALSFGVAAVRHGVGPPS